MSALDELLSHDRDPAPAIADWRAEGGEVVGYVGADVPRELIAAAGFLPVRLRGAGPSTPFADGVLGARVDQPVRAVLAELLDPARERPDRLILCHDCDATVRLFTSLRMLGRLDGRLPDVHFFDLLHLPAPTTASYDLDRVHELAGVLAGWSGKPIGEAALRAAIAEANETRRLLGRLQALRRGDPVRLSGSVALALIGAGTVLPAAGYNRLLAAFLEEEHAPVPSGRLVYLTGSGHVTTAAYLAIEAAGAAVVGEDHEWGEALADGLVAEGGDPFEAISARYHAGCALGRRHGSNVPAAWIAAEARAAGAELVVAWIRDGDDARAWDVPEQRRRVEEAGLQYEALDHRGLEPAGLREVVAAQ